MATSAQRGSGTPATTGTTWATATNAVDGAAGTNPATYATLTSTVSAAVATIEITGYGFSALPSDVTLTNISVTVRHFENNTGRFASVVFQPFDGATAIGSPFTCTLATAARNDTQTFTPTLAQLKSATFKIRVTITGAASTQSRVESIDYADVTATYTAPVKQGSATDTWTETAAVVGKRVAKSTVTTSHHQTPAAVGKKAPRATATTTWREVPAAQGLRTIGARSLEAAATRSVEGGGDRVLESFVVTTTKQGSAVTTSYWVPAATGKRTPKAAVTTTYREAPTTVGKRTPKAAVTIAHTWAPSALGVRQVGGRRLETALGRYTEGAEDRLLESAYSPIVVRHIWTPSASGRRTSRATAIVTYKYVPRAVGPGVSTDLVGMLGDLEFMAMQWGDQEVVAWQLNGVGAGVLV